MRCSASPQPQYQRLLVDALGGQEHRAFEGGEEALVGQGVLDRGQVVLGVGPDQQPGLAAGADGHGHAQAVAVELGAADRAQGGVGLVDHEAQVLQGRDHRAQGRSAVRGLEDPLLDRAQGEPPTPSTPGPT